MEITCCVHTVADYERLSREAENAGIRIEMVRGLGVWEAFPGYRHQQALVRIANSVSATNAGLENPCGRIAVMDLSVRFPDGSHKRPDLAVFCREPDEQDTEVTLLPEAVVEVLSADYEAKDLLIGVPFYQQVGIKDIVVFDPRTSAVRHWQQGQPERTYESPVTLTFLCGCSAIV